MLMKIVILTKLMMRMLLLLTVAVANDVDDDNDDNVDDHDNDVTYKIMLVIKSLMLKFLMKMVID